MKDWLSRPLRALAQVDLGRQRSPEHANGFHMVPYLRAANVVDGELDLSDVKEMNFTPREQEFFSLQKGDILVTEGSGSLRTVGASAVWRNELPGTVCFQNTLLRIRPRSCETDLKFLEWWCRFAYVDGLFAGIGVGANIFHLSAERVRSLPVRCPQRPEQEIISEFLNAETARIDALVAKKHRMIALVHEKANQSMVTILAEFGFNFPGEMAPDWETVPLPCGWRVVRLSQVLVQLTNGYVGPTRNILADSGVRYIQSLHIKDGKIDFDRRPFYVSHDWHSGRPRIHLRAGDVLIVQTGDIGRVAVVPEGFGPASCHALQIARVRRDMLSGAFLAEYLRTPFGYESLLSRATGALHPHLEGGIRDVPVILPPKEIQHVILRRIGDERDHRKKLESRLVRQIGLLREHRQALITAAVTGEMNVPGIST